MMISHSMLDAPTASSGHSRKNAGPIVPGRHSPTISFGLSVVVHALVLIGGAMVFQTAAEYGVDAGRSSIAVNLVAAAPEPESVPESAPDTPKLEDVPPVETPDPEDMTVPVAPAQMMAMTSPAETPVERPKTPRIPKPRRVVETPSAERGDGSSRRPGKDATSASSDGGAIMDSRPDYLRNPAPVYPEFSRREKQEGVVTLQVILNTDGRPESVTVRESSGFRALDDSAIAAVKGWRFRPASVGGVSMRSRVTVPVRFHLD